MGACFRTADGAGVVKLFLTGYTPDPYDRFGVLRPDFAKVALGAERSVAWERVKDIRKLIATYKKRGVYIVALEQDPQSIDYKTVRKRTPLMMIVGNEVDGVARIVRSQCDAIMEIPMRGEKESLNVSVAFGIAVYACM